MFQMNKRKILVNLCREYNGIYQIEKVIRIKNDTAQKVRYKDGTYKIDQKIPSFANKKGDKSYFFDMDSGSQLNFREIKNLDPKALDLFVSRDFVNQISTGLNPDAFSIQMKNFILGGVSVGAIVGFVMMILIYTGVL